VDGKVSDYYEWLSAGFATPGGGEAMHRVDKHIEKIYFGYVNNKDNSICKIVKQCVE